MSKQFDYLVFIGRFQPFHKGHKMVIDKALSMANSLILLCGSSFRPRSLRNPWFFSERAEMIRSCFSTHENKRIFIHALRDVSYNDELWVRGVQQTVKEVIKSHSSSTSTECSVGLIGHEKDQTSYYLHLFPQWGGVAVENFECINSTNIRNDLFSQSKTPAALSAILPANVVQWMQTFSVCKDFTDLCEEFSFIKTYQSAWKNAPYPPIFVTVDAVVVQSGHILMVKRRSRPGKGLFALPGGFVNLDESLLEACLRELKEETRLKVPLPVLKGSIVTTEVFDKPKRSDRGRTITHVFYLNLKSDKKLPQVKGGSDARTAVWIPLGKLDSREIFEDHYFIIQKILGMV